ncbi:MAG: discoidin domain-containing protein [Bacteroidales bacterium]|nr:discoidin domain-containing protein [Bacteroidales bacterium]
MLKLFSTRKWLVTLLLLVAAMVMPVTGNAQVTLTYDSSSSGYTNETASNLFDGDTSTKWCYDAPSTSSSAWVVFKANEACRLKGYTITTANDNASNRNRNPKDWKIYGSNDKSNWTVLVSVSNDSKLQDENSTSYKYTLATGIATKYEYYKWEITANQGAGVFHVSEFSITVSQCTETKHEGALLLKKQRDATCTEVGYTQDVYQCSSCGRCYSDAEGTHAIDLASVIIPAKGHTFNGENGDCSVCGVSHMLSHAGTSADPFQINNADDLYWFAAWVNGTYTLAEGETAVTHLDACAVLTNDITVNTGVLNADGTLVSDVTGFREWTPIGRVDFSYDGIFNGQGHTISGLYFNHSQSSYVGFFGYTEIHSIISNVGIVDSYFCGSTYVGGMCGRGYGIIENCYNANTVSGTSIVGGVCGFKDYRPINNCYITGAVSGSDHVGGVCGYNYGTISNCYFNSEKCDKDAVGTNHGGTVTNTKGKTTAQFASGEVCYLLNKGVTNDTQSWYQNLASEGGDTYPVLKSNGNNTVYASQPCTLQFSNTPVAIEHSLDPDGFCTKCGGYEPATLTTDKHDINGDGEKDAVYEIANAGQLYWFAALVNGTLADGTAQNPSAKAVLLNDITVNTGVLTADGTLASDVSGFKVWTPIGNFDNQYKGTFDGQSHTVSGLYFNNSATDYVGLFGCIGSGGKITNVGVVDSYFYGKDEVGGVCGRNISASISNCYSAGTVSGSSSFVGGVCGYSDNGNISNCYSAGAVIGSSYVGGVCGNNHSGETSNCYSIGSVSGGENVGGVCGKTYYCTISNCYSAGAVKGYVSVGGVCGYNEFSTISNCYFDSEECDKDAIGTRNGGIATNVEGKTTAQFVSGEVCYLLNRSKSDGTQAWYQDLTPETGDKYPVLTSNGNNTVYYAPLLCGGINNVGNTYANTDTVSVEHVLGEEVSFNSEKEIYQKTCQRTGCGTAFYFADSKGSYAAEEDAEGAFTTDTYVLQDATEYVNQAVCTATEFTYTRSFPGTNWAAWYVPFELTLTEEICSKYKFSRISNVHQYDTDYNGTADKTIVESFIQKPGVTLQANYPYLVKPVTEADREMSLTLTNVVAAKAESNSIDCQSVDYRYTFTGTYSGLGDGGTADSSPYALFSDGQWWHFRSLSPMRHYLTISSLTPSYLAAPALIVLQVTGEEGATGIVNPYDENRKKSETYDLSGRRLPEHNQHGLMIRDGKVIWKK